MSYLNGPRSFSSPDLQAWDEQVAQAMEEAHRRGLAADASWQAWIAQAFPAVWRIYLGPLFLIVPIFIVIAIGLLLATGGTLDPHNASILSIYIVDLLALAGAALIFGRVLQGIHGINWVGRCVAVIYLYVIASWILGGFRGDAPFWQWVECFVASIITESVAKWWRDRHPWDD